MHTWTDRCVHSSEALLGLLGRAAKHSLKDNGPDGVTPAVDWNRILPSLFNHYLQLLELNVGAGQNPLAGRSWPNNCDFCT